ncbi:uncharacterized protein LOC143896590 [Temnothorax americanus]|uniref:uncharacterized protein LOC143896590 n=1 Tax=Temnothorax americanus TaxID=1964332 RepID=UPI004068EC29
MSDDTLKCVFCGQNKLGRIVKFTPVTIKKCFTVLEYRRSKPVLRKSQTTKVQRNAIMHRKFLGRVPNRMFLQCYFHDNSGCWYTDRAYDDVVITPDILGDTPDSDMQAEDEIDEQIEPDLQYDDNSPDEDED